MRIFEVFDADKTRIFYGKAGTLETFKESVDFYYNQDFEKARALSGNVLKQIRVIMTPYIILSKFGKCQKL